MGNVCSGAAENPFGPEGWTPDRIGSLQGKTYVITGTTNGCGFEATRLLLKNGASVVMLNRSEERSNAVMGQFKEEFGPDLKVVFILCDLAKLASVRAAAASVLTQAPQIDALICNAAIAQIQVQRLTEDGFESQIATNYYSHFLLSGLLFDRIAQSKGRIVSVGSNGHYMGPKQIQFDDMNFDKNYNCWDVYCHSKLAQHMFTYELQRRVKAAGKSVQAHICHPGGSKTNLATTDVPTWVSVMVPMFMVFAQSAEHGSWPEVMCATEEGLQDSKYYGPTQWAVGMKDMTGLVGECAVEPHAVDEEMARKLWAVSEEKVGLKWSP